MRMVFFIHHYTPEQSRDKVVLGETIHVDKLVRRVTHARLITKESDFDRMLGEPTDAITLQFETTPDSLQTVRLGDLIPGGSPRGVVDLSDSEARSA